MEVSSIRYTDTLSLVPTWNQAMCSTEYLHNILQQFKGLYVVYEAIEETI